MYISSVLEKDKQLKLLIYFEKRLDELMDLKIRLTKLSMKNNIIRPTFRSQDFIFFLINSYTFAYIKLVFTEFYTYTCICVLKATHVFLLGIMLLFLKNQNKCLHIYGASALVHQVNATLAASNVMWELNCNKRDKENENKNIGLISTQNK